MDQAALWESISQAALNYIVVSTISASNQKQTVTDLKTDLRTTKEDIMSEVKDTRQAIVREVEISTTSEIEILKNKLEGLEKTQENKENG